jgi:hypothetical protein
VDDEDDYFAADDYDDLDGYGEIEGLGEPEPQLTPEQALEVLEGLPPDQQAEAIRYLEVNHPGTAEPLLQAYTDRAERQRLAGAWRHLDNLNQVAVAQEARQAQEQEAQLDMAEREAGQIAAGYAQQQGLGAVPAGEAVNAAGVIYTQVIDALRDQGFSEELLQQHEREIAIGAVRAGVDAVRYGRISQRALGKV